MKLIGSDIVQVRGVIDTSIQRTLLDLSPLLDLDDLVAIGDQIVCEHDREYAPPTPAMLTLAALDAYIGSQHQRRGLKVLREAMDLVRVGADPPRETRLRLIIARSTLPNFEHDIEIRNAVRVTKIARMLSRGGWADPGNLAGRSLGGLLGWRGDFE
ncbi:hypothetical protein [Arthrobacter alpinus]|uniref:hypothetical protein n=1 Tax=Arthrobacter alpinus TaxID=656366 RepID=UPI0007818312|nr:hypothetical protein [Arthrobacter alpinus]